MEKILNQILSEIQGLKEGQNRIEAKVGSLENKVDNLEVEVKEIHRKTSIIFDQTAGLTEFKTAVKEDLKELKKEVSFIGHKEYENEKDVFNIKKQLEIIK